MAADSCSVGAYTVVWWVITMHTRFEVVKTGVRPVRNLNTLFYFLVNDIGFGFYSVDTPDARTRIVIVSRRRNFDYFYSVDDASQSRHRAEPDAYNYGVITPVRRLIRLLFILLADVYKCVFFYILFSLIFLFVSFSCVTTILFPRPLATDRHPRRR